MRVTVQTTLPGDWLRSRIDVPFEIVAETADFGAIMRDALTVDLPRTLAAYGALHSDLVGAVQREAARLGRLQPDLVVSNISYVALAAAAEAGIPAVGLSCFTWADILAGCAPDDQAAAAVVGEMTDCYGRADLLLRAEPAMAMSGLANLRTIGPIARRTAKVPLGQGRRVGLIGFGGIGLPLPMAEWARLDGWHWLANEAVPGRPDITPWQETGLSFSQLLASADVVVTKPGYGTFTECAVNGTPVLTLPRPGWPETPVLMDWLRRHGRVRAVAPEMLFSERLADQLQALFALPAKPLPEPSGASEAAEAVLALLRQRRA